MKKYQPDESCFVMTRDQVRAFDDWAINVLGVPSVALMENAGRSCAELIAEKMAQTANPHACIFCGTGNNGGDGFVIARHLLNRNFSVAVVICGNPAKIKGDAKINLEILEGLGVKTEKIDVDNDPNIEGRIASIVKDANMLVDAVFGTGLTGQLLDEHKRLIEAINSQDCPILSVDIPSGLDCDTGLPLGAAIKANCTVTFVAVKKGFTHETTREFTGEIYVASIGVEPGRFPTPKM